MSNMDVSRFVAQRVTIKCLVREGVKLLAEIFLATIFGGLSGIIFPEILEDRRTVNADYITAIC